MSILDELLDHLVAGDEEKAQKLFHEMIVTQSKIEWNKKQLPEGDLIKIVFLLMQMPPTMIL